MQALALLVDDDRHTLFFLEHLLRSTGLTLLKAGDGEQALELLDEYTPALIFLDMLLPRISGSEVLDFIARTPRLNATCVVVISSQSLDYFPDSLPLDRANMYLTKPVSPKDIRDAAQQAMTSVSGCL
jgi:twitching motility two-component system response regulator PilG